MGHPEKCWQHMLYDAFESGVIVTVLKKAYGSFTAVNYQLIIDNQLIGLPEPNSRSTDPVDSNLLIHRQTDQSGKLSASVIFFVDIPTRNAPIA